MALVQSCRTAYCGFDAVSFAFFVLLSAHCLKRDMLKKANTSFVQEVRSLGSHFRFHWRKACLLYTTKFSKPWSGETKTCSNRSGYRESPPVICWYTRFTVPKKYVKKKAMTVVHRRKSQVRGTIRRTYKPLNRPTVKYFDLP